MAIQEKRTEILVGLFLFIGLLICGILIVQFGRFQDRFQDKYNITLRFPDATGIQKGSDVKLGGAKVGTVSEKPVLNEKNNGIILRLGIHDGFKIPRGSKFKIGSSGLLGDSYIQIEPQAGAETGYIPADAVIEGSKSTGLSGLTDRAQEITEQTKEVLSDIRIGIQGINELIGKFDKELFTDENSDGFKEIMTNLRETSANLKTSSAKVDPLLASGESAMKKAEETFAKAGDAMDKLEPTITRIGKTAENLDKNFNRIGSLADDMKVGVAKLNKSFDLITSGRGLLPQLINDPSLKIEFANLIRNLRKHGFLWYKDSASRSPATSTIRPGTSRRGNR